MPCPNCGVENRPERKFCSSCGSSLRPACPSCGTANEPGDAFCGECGAALVGGAPVARAAATTASERRLVSVLFCDLVGFTTFSESMDPEDVREFLSSYFELARSVVDRYAGTIEKFIGDAVMAVWGVPVTNEDDADRAVRAALELVTEVAKLGEGRGVATLAARAGVLTGEAAVNLGASGQGMVAGDLVNTASRFQSAADAGAVLVGEATYLATRDAIAFTEVGDLTLKGKGEPVRAWRALRVVAQRKGIGRSDRLEPPFVGREVDLRMIIDQLHVTGRESRSRLVSVTGVAGIGKSRLAWEFLKYVDGLAETVYWHQGRSPSYGEGISFWALGEMVRERAHIAEGEDAESARAKVAAVLEDFVSDGDERRWMEPRLLHLLGLADAPPGDRQELFSAWRTFFERVAERGTVVMVFEELQWADSGLLEFIETIVEWSRQYPIFVVTLSRPEIAERRATWGAAARSFTSLHLEPLSDEAMRELVRGLVSNLPADAETRLVERAEGVPLYAVETVRSLLDRGVLVEREGTYELVGDVAGLEVPESLQSLIASRLDALPPEERSLVRDASVLGMAFSPPLLAGVSGMSEETLAPLLHDLVRKEVLFLESNPRSPERGQYGFVQSMIREVAYGTLSKGDRRAKHLATAHKLESLGDEELAGVVAAHYLDAYQVSGEGPERKAVAAKARDWLGQASARALSLGSSEEALAYAEQALEIATSGPERAALLEKAGEAARLSGDYEGALAHYEEAVRFYTDAGDPAAAGSATVELGMCLGWQGRLAEALARCEAALAAVGEGEGSDAIRCKLASAIARTHRMTGTQTKALEWAEVALPLAERLGDEELLREAFDARSGGLFNLGRRREAAALSRARRELVATGSLGEQARELLLSSVDLHDDDLRVARRTAADAADLFRRAGDRGMETMNRLNAVEFAIYLGEWDYARAALAEPLPGKTPRHTVWWRTCCEALLEALTGHFDVADRQFDEVDAQMREGQNAAMRDTLLHMRAMADLARGDLAKSSADTGAFLEKNPTGMNSAVPWSIAARASIWAKDVEGAELAISGMAALHGRWMDIVRSTVEAGVAALKGRMEEAADIYRTVAERWRALDVPLDLALCGVDAATVLDEEHRLPDLIEESREILTQLGAAPFLARFEAAVGAPAKVGTT
jgi:class 3 adenylate cyclase/tetratricopeptide (TPR) repeat protein